MEHTMRVYKNSAHWKQITTAVEKLFEKQRSEAKLMPLTRKLPTREAIDTAIWNEAVTDNEERLFEQMPRFHAQVTRLNVRFVCPDTHESTAFVVSLPAGRSGYCPREYAYSMVVRGVPDNPDLEDALALCRKNMARVDEDFRIMLGSIDFIFRSCSTINSFLVKYPAGRDLLLPETVNEVDFVPPPAPLSAWDEGTRKAKAKDKREAKKQFDEACVTAGAMALKVKIINSTT